MAVLRDLVYNLKSSILIHDSWQYRALPLLAHFVNYASSDNIEVIYRSDRELRFLKGQITRNVTYTKWCYGSLPPNTPLAGLRIVTNLWPGDEQVEWWLTKFKDQFIGVIHDDLMAPQLATLATVNIFLKGVSKVHIISSKMKAKSNSNFESFHLQNGKFISKEIKLEDVLEDEEEVNHSKDLGLSFNLSISNDERKERAAVVLPYLERRTESKIEIDSEDSDDPDDDLDI